MSKLSPWFVLFDGEGAADAPAGDAPAGDAAPAATTLIGNGAPAAPALPNGAPAGLPEGHAFAGLSADLQADPNLAKFAGAENPLEALAKGYQGAAGLIGKDPASLVDVSTLKEQEAVTAHLRTLGAPETAADYTFTPADGTSPELAEGPVLDLMREAAASVGVLPHQFQAVVGAAVAALNDASVGDDQEINASHTQNIEALRQEHGPMFDNQVALANLAVEKAGGENAKELAELFASSGIATSPALINFLARVGEGYTEDSAAGIGTGSGGPVAAQTALAEADALQAQAVTETDPFRQKQLIEQAVGLRKRAYGE